MGVYLPNVDMPKGDKVLTVQICPDGSIWQQYRGTVPNAKAVPIPPHGRLVDLDKLEQMFSDIDYAPYSGFDGTEPFYSAEDVAQIIRLAPTVIPAEPPKEENKCKSGNM